MWELGSPCMCGEDLTQTFLDLSPWKKQTLWEEKSLHVVCGAQKKVAIRAFDKKTNTSIIEKESNKIGNIKGNGNVRDQEYDNTTTKLYTYN